MLNLGKSLGGRGAGFPASNWRDEVQGIVTSLSKQEYLIPLAFQSNFRQTVYFSDQSLFFRLSILLMVLEGHRAAPPLPMCAPTTPSESSFCPGTRIASIWDSVTCQDTVCAYSTITHYTGFMNSVKALPTSSVPLPI